MTWSKVKWHVFLAHPVCTWMVYVAHPSSNHMIAAQSEVEPVTSWS